MAREGTCALCGWTGHVSKYGRDLDLCWPCYSSTGGRIAVYSVPEGRTRITVATIMRAAHFIVDELREPRVGATDLLATTLDAYDRAGSPRICCHCGVDLDMHARRRDREGRVFCSDSCRDTHQQKKVKADEEVLAEFVAHQFHYTGCEHVRLDHVANAICALARDVSGTLRKALFRALDARLERSEPWK